MDALACTIERRSLKIRCGIYVIHKDAKICCGTNVHCFFFFSSRRRHTRCSRDWSSDVCSSDLPAVSELVASGRTVEEVARLIGADWLVYQDLEDLIAACKHEDARIQEFDTSCFSGEYVTGDVTPEYLERLQLERSDAAKHARREQRAKLKVVRGS